MSAADMCALIDRWTLNAVMCRNLGQTAEAATWSLASIELQRTLNESKARATEPR